MGCGPHVFLSKDLINYLNGQGIVVVKHAVETEEALTLKQEWKYVESLGLNQIWKIEWDCWMVELRRVHMVGANHMLRYL